MPRGGRADFLFANIGRGHPFYLDGILACLDPRCVGRVEDVFALCHGPSGWLWRLARLMYAAGSSGGGRRPLYTRLRTQLDYQRAGPLLHLMGLPLRRAFAGSPSPLVVAHPLLVTLLRATHPHLIYQHGELAVPTEALAPGASLVLVPDARAADAVAAAGTPRERIGVTGLCVEPGLVAGAADAYAARQARLASAAPLSGAFFSSGAEPVLHVGALVGAAASAAQRGGRVILVAREGGRFHAHALRHFRGLGLPLVVGSEGLAGRSTGAELIAYRTRADLVAVTEACVPGVDYVAAPAHERSHWALGLGLPMFIADPPIGSFAPLNRSRLLEEGVAQPLATDEGGGFGARLERLRETGALGLMAAAGWGRHRIDGFAQAAEMVRARIDAA